MLISEPPDDWRDLQAKVAQILSECGMSVEIEKNVKLARGQANIDVFAEDGEKAPPAKYFCECKYWKAKVPQSVVHAFRTVVTDGGANTGLLISSEGFQRGCMEAVKNSNLRLVTWGDFQELFSDRWFVAYMCLEMEKESEPLQEYTEPYNTALFRKADALPEPSREHFIELRKKWMPLAFLSLPFFRSSSLLIEKPKLQLPLKEHISDSMRGDTYLPSALLEVTTLRGFLDVLRKELRSGLSEFDAIFGGRAV